jgi:folate-binding protein YgfZ
MDYAVYEAARSGFVRREMGHFGRFRVWGKDAANLLHHLTTQDVKAMRPGEVREATLVTSKARVLDWLTVLRRHESDFWIVTSPNRKQSFKTHALRYVLFRQEVTIDDVAGDDTLWGVFGPRAGETPGPRWPTRRLPGEGFLTFGPPEDAVVCDTETYNTLRIEAGIPVAGAELTEDYNPWEANLDFAIASEKGCYNGQEIIARLNTYKKVKQRLVGLTLECACPPKQNLRIDGKDIGFMTSCTNSPTFGHIALGYVRNEWILPGTELEIADTGKKATVTPIPFGHAESAAATALAELNQA